MKRTILMIIISGLLICTTSFADYITETRTQIYNQGKTSACVAYSIKTVIEMWTGNKVNYRDIYKYHEPDGGMYIDKTLDKLGLSYDISLYDTEKIKQAIIDNKGVLINIQIDKSIYKIRKEGILDKYNNSINTYHCMVIIGWITIGDKEYWIVQNSWSKYWGCSGICYIPFDYSLIDKYYIIKRS